MWRGIRLAPFLSISLNLLQLPTSELAGAGVSHSGARNVAAVDPVLPLQLHVRGVSSARCTLFRTVHTFLYSMAPMMFENENDVEVGESLPPMTEHVSQCFTSSTTEL